MNYITKVISVVWALAIVDRDGSGLGYDAPSRSDTLHGGAWIDNIFSYSSDIIDML